MELSLAEIAIISISLALFSSALYLVTKNKPVDLYWLTVIIIFNPVLGPLVYLSYYPFTRKHQVLVSIRNLKLEINSYFSK